MKERIAQKKRVVLKEVLDDNSIDFLKYDNICRDSHISTIHICFTNSPDFRGFQEFCNELRVNPIYSDLKIPTYEFVINAFEHMLTLYQIGYNIVRNKKEDSILLIEPALNEKYLTQYIGVLTQLLPLFPYSFYKKIETKLFSFYGKIELKNQGHINTYLKKYYGWNFMIDEHQTFEEIKFHFLSVVWFNASRLIKDFQEKWKKFYVKSDREICRELFLIPNSMVYYPQSNPDHHIITQLKDQFKIFQKLIEDPSKVLNDSDPIMKEKASLIKEALKSLDPEGLGEEWWKYLIFMR